MAQPDDMDEVQRPSPQRVAEMTTEDTAPVFDPSCRSRSATVIDGRLRCMCATNWDCLDDEICVDPSDAADGLNFEGVCAFAL